MFKAFRLLNEPSEVREKIAATFWRYARPSQDGCWAWSAGFSRSGYGKMYLCEPGRRVSLTAGRIGYELLVGEIPEGLMLDHLCRNRGCVNPKHLEPVTNQENARRGIGGRAASERALKRTHCFNGHEYTPENNYYRKKTGFRICRICVRISNKVWRDKLKASGWSRSK